MTCFPLVPSFNSAGEAWDSVIPVNYVNPENGQNVTVTVEVDTGASYSLAPASLASILGIALTAGTPIQLQGVGASAFAAYLHRLTLEIGNLKFDGILIAIANVEDVPFLLGRTNFWDFASIRIDDVNRQVCIDPILGASSIMTPQLGASQPAVTVGLVFLGLGAAAFTVYLLVKT